MLVFELFAFKDVKKDAIYTDGIVNKIFFTKHWLPKILYYQKSYDTFIGPH